MGERLIFGVRDEIKSVGPTFPFVWRKEPGRRNVGSTLVGLWHSHNLSRSDLPFFDMRDHNQKGSSTKFSNGATASASRNEDPIHKLIREYFDYSPGFASIPASVIARYLGAMLTEYVGSTENRDEITMCDMAYHATRTISFIIALQEAFGKEEGHG